MTANPPKLLVFSCLAVLPLLSCAPGVQVTGEPATDANAPTVAAAQRISLDGSSATEALTAAGLNNEPSALAARAADEVRLPDGTVGVRVAKRYYHTISVCRQADGSFSSHCPATAAAAP
jgi:hypothetical protein